MNCQVFKSARQADTYLYLPDSTGFDVLPESLMDVFGTPEKVMNLTLEAGTRLAQADAAQVIQAINEQGYYLQLPPDVYKSKHNPWA